MSYLNSWSLSLSFILIFYASTQAQIQVIRKIDIPIVAPSGQTKFIGSANMDKDPNEELVFLDDRTSRIFIIDGNSGNIEWDSSPAFVSVWISGVITDLGRNFGLLPPFCDINNDGIKEITFSGYTNESPGADIFVVGLEGVSSIPREISLSQNYPNPFNNSTTIEYEITAPGHTGIYIYDITGRLVRTLVDKQLNAGEHSIVWDGKNDNGILVSSGQYFYRMKVDDYMSSKKAILVK